VADSGRLVPGGVEHGPLLQEHRTTIRRLEARLRDMEEAMKLLAVEQRHARELETAEREKLLLRIKAAVARPKELPAPRRKRGEP
jgi:hypothetical protein